MTWKTWQKGCPFIEFFGSCFMHKHALLQHLAWMLSCFTSGTNASRATEKKNRVPLSVTVWDNLHDTSYYCSQNLIFIPVCTFFFFFRDPHWKSFCNGLEQSVDFRSAYLSSVLCLGTNNRFFFLACCCLDDVWLCTLVYGFWSCNDSAEMVKHALLSQYAPFWVSFVCFFAFVHYCLLGITAFLS